MAQVNFTISDELKAELDKAIVDSGAESKPEFLQQVINAFHVYKANNVDIDIDLSKYESVNVNTKEALSSAFKHILTTLDANFSMAKQDAVYVDAEKKALIEKEEAFKVELLKVASDANSRIDAIEADSKELITKADADLELLGRLNRELQDKNKELEKEFANVSKVADQVGFISSENKELRDTFHTREAEHKKEVEDLLARVKLITGEITEVKQSLFKTEIQSESKDREISALTEQLKAEKEARASEVGSVKKELEGKLSNTITELAEVKGKYNQAIGKLEILEKSE